MEPLEKINLKLHSLVIFRNLLYDPVIEKLSGLLSCLDKSQIEKVNGYASFASVLFLRNDNLTAYVLDKILEDENIYCLKRAQNLPVDSALKACLKNELAILEDIAQVNARELKAKLLYDGFLPEWKNSDIDFMAAYMERMDNLHIAGYGIYSKNHMFTVEGGMIIPIHAPDLTALSDLKSYEQEIQAVVQNTLALLEGKPAANVLLYGDAGTGKSSTVKAIANEYRCRGLRLIEIPPKQYGNIPVILEALSKNPLKFILFLDDLSFAKDNENFKALKAILEGSAFCKTPNIAIYATSNRRHLVKESFADRSGDDIHQNDTIQELVSLSDRFGLLVSFYKPDKETYLRIVHALRDRYGIEMNNLELDIQAEKYALLRGGRSPRVARQFLEHIKSMGFC
ncbi:MAG: ATP-binding protein [Christensenellales bacterium]